MSKVAVIYWSGTGNTKMMAEAVSEGAKNVGAEVSLLNVSETSAAEAASFDVLALGCPAMGGEVLEEMEFEPFFTELESKLSGKKVALFGSYGWGDGQWMRDWVDRMSSAGANVLNGEGVICKEAPDDEAVAACTDLGRQLAAV